MFKKFTISHFIVLIIILSSSLSCIPHRKYYGAKPIYPSIATTYGSHFFHEEVDSLQPEFRWEASQVEGTTYDFAIFEPGEKIGGFFWEPNRKWQWGNSIYYVEDIKENSHKIKIQLKPDTLYCWSVRLRRGNKFGDWSTFDYDQYLPAAVWHWRNLPFTFKTPSK